MTEGPNIPTTKLLQRGFDHANRVCVGYSHKTWRVIDLIEHERKYTHVPKHAWKEERMNQIGQELGASINYIVQDSCSDEPGSYTVPI